ncbi:MAG: thiol oxidoreductase [Actinomycetota bacterium]|nr:thiol oxidoreductase [Actinomycetota bacterium]
MRRGLVAAIAMIACSLAVYLAASRDPSAPDGDRRLAGGADATVFDTTGNAFALPVPKLSSKDRRAFAVGNSFFNRNWVTAPASATGRDGLGPTFNAVSCSSCHFKDGRAQPPTSSRVAELGLLLRLSVADRDGRLQPVARYGGQLQDRAINGVRAEGRIRITHTPRPGRYGDGTSYTLIAPRYEIVDRAFGALPTRARIGPRVAPAIFGVGLLEAVPEKTITDRADPQDADGDGISGRPNRVDDARSGAQVLGRFGWKANVPTVEQQNASAFSGDIGITSPIFPDEGCPDGQDACKRAPRGGRPEIDAKKLDRVTFYARTLAVPARRAVQKPDTSAGERIFSDLGCSSCHLPQLRTATSDVAALSDQDIRPYTDLLLHDMGPGLADGRPDGLAGGSEWRTAPLWGIGLVRTVNRHTRFLHDGRARSIEEAILWHGGEAAAAQRRFGMLPARQRRDLIAFLGSL